MGIALLFGSHAVLALGMEAVRPLATVHALAALAVGVFLATTRRTSEGAVLAVCYLATSELLWRINRASIFWEFSKYAVVLVAVLLLARRPIHRGLATAAFAFLLLLSPGAGVTVAAWGITGATREALSTSLSGPLCLAVLVMLFSSLESREIRLERVLLWLAAPLVGLLTLVFYGIASAGAIRFGTHSNFATSAGYGPNQVSATLSLGAIVFLLLAIHERSRLLKLSYLALTGAYLLTSVLTFSRGGLFNVAIFGLAWGAHYLRSPKVRGAAFGVALVLALASLWIVPQLDRWTGGSLRERYSSLDTTGRKSLAQADLELFQEQPILGVGAGRSTAERQKLIFKRVASHTEYTRLLAEHGVFGIAALLVMLGILGVAYLRAPESLSRGWVAAMGAWTFASLAHVSMRLAIIPLLFGLATLTWRRRAESAPRPRIPVRSP